MNVKYQACEDTAIAHITPVRDRKCGTMCLLIKSKAEGEGTVGVLQKEAGKGMTAV